MNNQEEDLNKYILTENSKKSCQPNNIKLNLKPHQLASLYRLIEIDKHCGFIDNDLQLKSNIGIFADLPGYGKTITFLSMIECLKEEQVQWMPHIKSYTNNGYGIIYIVDKKNSYNLIEINTTLIVVPDNLISHWQKHIDNYTILNYELVTKHNFNKIIPDGYDIILCPAKLYNSFIEKNMEYIWNRVAFDEADSINIPNTIYIPSRFIWIITATYENMSKRKNNGFLRDLFKCNWINNNPINKYFYNVIVKCQEDFVKKSFIIPELTENIIECITPEYISAIKNHITTKTLEYINAGDLDNAIISLGGKIDTDRNIIVLITRNIDNKIITLKAKLNTLEQLDLSETEKQEKRIKIQTKLTSLITRKQSLEDAILQVKKTNCSICLDIFKLPTITPCCNNMFCVECLIQWIKDNNTCPMCRNIINISQLHTITDNINLCNTNKNTTSPDKLSALLKIIQDKPKGKFLVFSGHSQTFKLIESAFIKENIEYSALTMAKTEKILEKFRAGQINVILLNAEHNGAGLEIPEATDVILYHEMKKHLELQAISRAQRTGRKIPLQIWKLKYSHEYSSSCSDTWINN
jgi:hypothetical protein